MPTRYVQLPNGKYLEWPEGVSAADFKAKAQRLVAPETPGLEPGQSLPGVGGIGKTELHKLDTLSPGGGWSPDEALRGAGAGIKQLITHPIDSMATPGLGGMPGFAPGKSGEQAQEANSRAVEEGATNARGMIKS